MTARTRLLLVLLPFLAIFYTAFFAGMSGDDDLGLVSFLLAAAALFVMVQATWLRGRLSPMGVMLWNPLVVTVLGAAYGTLSAGEAAIGVAAGVVIGLLAGLATLWLGSLVQLKRRPRVFLSYRRDDSAEETARLHQALARRYHSRNVFIDVQTMRLGTDFRVQIAKTIKRCDGLFAVMAERWLDIRDEQGRRRLDAPDDPVRIEIETALAANVTVVPLLVGAARVPTESDLPETLRPLAYHHALKLRRGPEFDEDCVQLISRFEEGFRPYTADSLAPPPPKAKLTRRITVGVLAVLLLVPFGWRLVDELTSGPRSLGQASVSPDGTRLATLHGHGTLRVWNLATGALEGIHTYPAEAPWPTTIAWSPDSRLLAVGDHEGAIALRDAATLEETRVLAGHQGNVSPSSIAWSPDGTRLAAGDDVGTVHVWRADTGAHLASTVLFSTDSDVVSWSPRGDMLAVSGVYDHGLYVLAVGASQLTLAYEYSGHRSWVNQIAWSPDGTKLASGGYEAPYLVVHSLSADGFTSQPLAEQTRDMEDLRWSPDGRMLAATSAGSFDSIVRIWDATGILRQQLLMAGSLHPTVAWSPDSAAIASADETAIRVWSASDARPIVRWTQDQDLLGTDVVGWTAQGRIVTDSSGDDTIRVWRVDAGAPVAVFTVTLWDLL